MTVINTWIELQHNELYDIRQKTNGRKFAYQAKEQYFIRSFLNQLELLSDDGQIRNKKIPNRRKQ